MFTGIIESLGKIKEKRVGQSGNLSLKIHSNFKSVKNGESIAVNGVCLTVTGSQKNGSGNSFDVDISNETVRKTTLKNLEIGALVNLERALKLSDRLGGHFVLGHVDSPCKLVGIHPEANGKIYTFSYPKALDSTIVSQGSVAIDGISLTIARIDKRGLFSVAIVPYTEEHTSLKEKKVGDELNLEVDILTKVIVQQIKRIKK